MLLEGIPVGMELEEVESAIRNVKGVLDLHDLHVWTISSGLIACSCHIVVAEQNISGGQKILEEVAYMLEHDFSVSHTTIQIEAEDCGGHDHTPQKTHEHVHNHAH